MTASSHRGRRFLLQPALALAFAGAASAAAQAEIYLGADSAPTADLLAVPLAEPRQPVLFVHGHNLLSADDSGANGFNYRKNFHQDPGAGLTSFQQALDAPANAWLGIEPYYIRFQDQHRSIVEDAADIADAVERILQRHDSAYTPGMASPTTQVRVAIIAYSKGTISSRLYLKSLQTQVNGLPPPRAGFDPVSELVALSPPNHGLATAIATNLASKQLNNGCSGCVSGNCLPLSGSEDDDFIELLNGHPIEDTRSVSYVAGTHFDSEAPGSRPNGAPLVAGTLYTCLFADGGRDFVGGSSPSSDCQGRVLAANLATEAVNVEVASIPGSTPADVHQDTPHTPEVVCRALTTVVHHRAPTASFACMLDGDVPRIPPRTAVELVLDYSGSMLLTASPGGPTRLEVLEQAVEMFCELYAVFAGPGDRLGAVFFGSSVSEFTPGGVALLPVTDANVDAFEAELAARSTVPGELTALGGGLAAALASFESPEASGAAERHVVLFTDGMQNVMPRVSTPPPPLTIATIPPIALDSLLGVRVHTIGIGSSSPFVDLLSSIASETGGTHKVTLDAVAELQEFFELTLVEALKGNSPQLVDYRRGTFGGGTVDERFEPGAGATKLVLQLNWRGKSPLRFTVERDGADVTALGRFVDGRSYRLFVADLAPSGAPASSGTWTMRITGDASTDYEAAALVDEPRIEMHAALARPSVRAGEPIRARVSLRLDGRPWPGSASVRARVAKPGDSTGNLLSRSATPSEPPGFALEGADPAQRKLALVLADERNWKLLDGTSAAVELATEQAGSYSAAFDATDVPGLYRIEVEADGDSQATGAFRRRQTLVATVHVGALDARASKLRVARSAGAAVSELSLRPRDGFGNYLGPGWASSIAVSAGGEHVGALVDELDGTYRVQLPRGARDDVELTVSVGGEILYQGPLSGLASSGRRPGIWIGVALIVLLALASGWILRQLLKRPAR